MGKKYVVLERHFEYDDNYYTSSEGGNPLVIFDTRKEADEYDRSLTEDRLLELVTSGELSDYIRYYSTDWDKEKVLTFMGVKDLEGLNTFRVKDPHGFGKQWAECAKAFEESSGLSFYDVREVEHYRAAAAGRKKKTG